MKISFLIHTVYGIGGTIRTTLNLAEELVNRHEVEIVSVFRHRDDPLFSIDPRITVVPLVDTRVNSPTNEKEHPFQLQPATFLPQNEARYKEYSRLTDDRVREHYAASDADVVVGTRPGLVAYVAQFAPTGAVRIGQEHMTHNHHKAALRAEMYEHLAAIDAFVTVSEGDARVWRDKMPLPSTRVLAIPNSVPEPQVAPSDGTGSTVVAAGRLATEKQYNVLIDAFAKVTALRPDWVLRIYGGGDRRPALRDQILRMGLYNKVHLMGPHSPIEPEWAKGAIAVSTSRHESFGMTLVEAMRCGLPVISTDCDYGPREIIKDGVDGVLVPVGDVKAVVDALLRLIDDQALRHRLGAAAQESARRFDPSQVVKEYENLFEELAAGESPRGSAPEFAPVADCVVAADGALTITLVGPRPTADEAGLRLLCARTEGSTEVRTFAFGPNGSVTIPAGEQLGEGVWELFVEMAATGARSRLGSRNVDQRGAMHAAERLAPGEAVRNLVPYADKAKGTLVLRSWVRPVHAEAADVRLAGKKVTLSGRLIGATPVGDPVLVLRRRGGPACELTISGRWDGASTFRFTIPCAAPVAQQNTAHDVWDTFLRYVPNVQPVKIGRVLDDVVMKKDVYNYPLAILPKKRRGSPVRALAKKVLRRPKQRVRVRLFYTASNDLALNVVDL
ncbi:glycosyltransferase family 4 protein [Streptomyces sp. ISL-1]|uniref:glycosyltransferase family 4 protein n=1 Tax=Streptomyces sp. ISL-1 TaxID=2817657 RepID=UPI001BE6B140|nr:glycosyltransferase family 4 protein [Streptomyces sp. ISL-1]MBT2391608.1 glycosyltransferase family 4 protein [Streptomyces sp. ISL-1]